LADKLTEGEDLSQSGLSEFIDVGRLISDVRAKKGPEQIKNRLFETQVDVQSVEEAKIEIQRDSSLSSIEKA